MSDTERDAHRQELRDASTHVTVALPHTGGELAPALSQLEEVLLALVPEDPGDDVQLPASLTTHHGADAVGRLAGYVAVCRRNHRGHSVDASTRGAPSGGSRT